MSLDVTLTALRRTDVYDGNITHNLGKMAAAAGIYYHLWRPEEVGVFSAQQLIEPLERGLKILLADEAQFRKFDALNGWGKYEHLVEFVKNYLQACRDNQDADVSVSR